MTTVGHSIIRASAGSGKTYELVRRMIRLLALGVEPKSIVALTFTRKAAGEFFARLLQKLAEFAENPEGARDYLPELSTNTRAICLKLLRSVIENMDQLRLGTLDSFFAAMVQSLPFELGLTGAGTIMSEHEKDLARHEALDAVLVDVMRPENEAARKLLVESWKLATFGSEGNAPARELDQWFKSLHAFYLECSDAALWGAPTKIWKDEMAAIWLEDRDLAAASRRLEAVLDVHAFKHKKAEEKWADFFKALTEYLPGTPMNRHISYMLDEERGDKTQLRDGRGSWKVWKTKDLSMEESRALHHLLALIVGTELRIICQRTQGKNRLLGIYEEAHRRLVRGLGRLAFDDLALLLAGRLNPNDAADWTERWKELQQDMEFRLNARYDHWLFDEFQDTSHRQWRVFENLVEEVLQDPEGNRTFFAVGDLKQSIYLWREAEPELFLRVEKKHEKKLERRPLNVSWRSSPDVLAMVNALFGNTEGLRAELPSALEWWTFETHEASKKRQSLRGHSVVLSVPTKEDKDAALVALLRKVQPRARGLSCAVLTRSNAEAQRIASLLRHELRCDVVCESEEAVATDNAVTLVLLSIIQLGAHPQDGMAWHHVRMTPLRRWVEQHRFNAARTGEEVRRDLLRGGFLSVAEKWSERLHEVFPELDAFGEWRLRQFLEMCARFDESGSRDVDAFQSYAREHRVAVTGATQALQVMTIHKSKGLEFDLVILPHLQESILDDASDLRLLKERDENGATQWVLDRPAAILLEWDGALVPNVDKHRGRSAFEGLCLLYVAMTRAKQGLYVITNDEPKPKARSEAKLVRTLLNPGGESVPYDLPDAPFVKALYESGAREWFAQYPLKSAEEVSAGSVAAPEQDLGELLRAVNQPVQRRTPSEEENFHLLGRDFLTPQREVSRRMGTLVHELFEAVTWLDADGTDEIWRARGLDRRVRFGEAAERVTKALQNEAVRKYFENTGGSREVWTERRFDLLLDQEWISGTLDRVVLERDAKGACTQATIVDFKTDSAASMDQAKEKAASYAPQLDLYKKAVQRLTGLSAVKIKTALIFVAGPWVVEG